MDWFLSCVGHFVTFCWRHSTESQSVTAHEFHCGFEYRTILPGGTEGYPAQPGLIRPSVCPSVCPSVRACRLGIEQKMAQAQQIRSIILQNNESM